MYVVCHMHTWVILEIIVNLNVLAITLIYLQYKI